MLRCFCLPSITSSSILRSLKLAGIVCCVHSSVPSGFLSFFVCQVPDGNVALSDSALLSINL